MGASPDNWVVNSFLHYGYLPWALEGRQQGPRVDWRSISRDPSVRGLDERALLKEGVQRLRGLFAKPDETLHVVPLSGGLDSRTILAGLLESTSRDRIVAVTFGVPGSWDYELGVRTARKLDVRHELVDLRTVKVDTGVLLQAASSGGSWTFLFDVVYNRHIASLFGASATIWSGYLGDPVAGSHLESQASATWREACGRFAQWNAFVRSCRLVEADFNPVIGLPAKPLLDGTVLDFDEQLDFCLRQVHYVTTVVAAPGHTYRFPFTDLRWLRFFYSIPRTLRLNKRLYREILLKAFPKAFGMPTSDMFGASLASAAATRRVRGFGARLRRRGETARWYPAGAAGLTRFWEGLGIYRSVNYMDFGQQVQVDGTFAETIRSSLETIRHERLAPWVDVQRLWRETHTGLQNHGDALALLTALEISLRVTTPTVPRGTFAYEPFNEGRP